MTTISAIRLDDLDLVLDGLPDPRPQHDLSEATRFLSALTKEEEPSNLRFQTYRDSKEPGPYLSRSLPGSLEQHLPELIRLNEEGAAVCVQVNMPGEIRALFADFDKGVDLDTLPLKPSVVVSTSPGKLHCYWLVSGNMSKETFDALAKVLVTRFNADGHAKDITHVLRLPGLLHRKGAPYLVHVVDDECTFRTHREQELVAAFQPEPVADLHILPDAIAPDWEQEKPRVVSALKFLPAEGYDSWRNVCFAIWDASGGSQEGYQAWDDWSRTCPEKYDSKAQRKQWADAEKRSRTYNGPRIGLGSIYDEATSMGWVDASGPSFGCITPDGAYFEGEHPLADAAMADVESEFASFGHHPSDDHMRDLREISQALERMADGRLERKLYLNSSPPGMGKTSTACYTIKRLLEADMYRDVGVIIFVFRLTEIPRLVEQMGLTRGSWARLTSDSKADAEGHHNANQARVLFTTQARLLLESDYQRVPFGEMKAFFFNGKPRQVRIWDEAVDPSVVYTLDERSIDIFKDRLRKAKLGDLANILALWTAETVNAATGDKVVMPCIRSDDVSLEALREACRGNAERNTAQALYTLSGREVRVFKDSFSGRVTYHYDDVLPADIFPMVVLDASGPYRETYPLWERFRLHADGSNQIVRLKSHPKSYEGLTIHFCSEGIGIDKHENDAKRERIAEGIAATIRDEVDNNVDILHISKHVETEGENLEQMIANKVGDRVGALSFINYGQHTATNDHRNTKVGFITGALIYPPAQYEALGRAAKAAKIDDETVDEDTRRVRLGEIAHHFYQAACRTAVRKAEGDRCPSGCHLYFMFSNKGATAIPRDILSKLFPGAAVIDWDPFPKELKGLELVMAEALFGFAQRHLRSVGEKVTLTTRKLDSLTGIINRGSRSNALESPRVLNWLSDRGISLEKFHGKVVLTKTPSRIELPF